MLDANSQETLLYELGFLEWSLQGPEVENVPEIALCSSTC